MTIVVKNNFVICKKKEKKKKKTNKTENRGKNSRSIQFARLLHILTGGENILLIRREKNRVESSNRSTKERRKKIVRERVRHGKEPINGRVLMHVNTHVRARTHTHKLHHTHAHTRVLLDRVIVSLFFHSLLCHVDAFT